MATLSEGWRRVRLPTLLLLALVVISLATVALVKPSVLTAFAPATITGDVVSDRLLFDEIRGGSCSDAYEPVCGSDGETYENYCVARQAGVELRYTGEC